MKELDKKLTELRDQTWQAARDSLEGGEALIYRSLNDIAERLTKLIGSSDKLPVATNPKGEMLPIFYEYKGETYEAQLDVARINGGRRKCVLMEGKWWTAGGSARHITNTSVNGWRQFWRYNKDGFSPRIEELKKQTGNDAKY